MDNKIYVKNNGITKSVFVCSPDNFTMTTPINYTEKQTFKQGIDKKALLKEHISFVDKLNSLGIKAIHLPLLTSSPQQVFTRDLGFVIDDTVYIGKSSIPIRLKEHIALLQTLPQGTKLYKFDNYIEGGDVVIYNNYIFVGLSNRTNLKAIEELKKIAPNTYKVIVVKLKETTLHLDCALNVAGNYLVVDYNAIKDNTIDFKDYSDVVIQTCPKETRHLPTNFLNIGYNTILANSNCAITNRAIAQQGIIVIEQPFNEMLKLGGSFRCCSLESLKL